ncbi:MAG: DNA translocase FtsK, partial [Peptococcaceae bacterium]|nr:DNA translocase FtsK [Peptococcaceae bacterium]
MSEQKYKSQADKAAASKKKKVKKPAQQNKTKSAKVSVNSVPAERKLPVRLISSASLLGLFVLFLIIFFQPDGVVIRLLDSFVHGLIGHAGFLVSIPALLYLFIIHAFSGGRPVKMRTICIALFVLVCGCISHLSLTAPDMPVGWEAITNLYYGGIEGSTAGLICGGVAMLFYWLFQGILSYIIFILAAIFLLLGGMQITIVSIIRAIQDRPRPNWEEKPVERPEPATIVVNHIANKRIEHLEQKRERQKQQAAQTIITAGPAMPVKHDTAKVEDMFRQIDADIEKPVNAASEFVPAPVEPEPTSNMPPFDKNAPFPEKPESAPKKVKVEKVTAKEAKDSAEKVAKEIADAQKEQKPEYCFPPIDLLKSFGSGATDGTMEMRENTRRLNETLASFKIEAHIINVTRGPSVTRYEVELEKGVRLNKLTTAADDIALSLGATGVRIAAVPGKISVVGIEVPNRAVTTVSLREVIDSQEFAKAKSKSSFAVGKDIGGNSIVGNIARLPHMLIAGTTGSGKSVCMNSIIISLLYKASPDDVKLIMVDPKMVELGIYNGIPHLLIPVVTDPKKAAGSLQWAVSEMMRRYKAMADAGVRD